MLFAEELELLKQSSIEGILEKVKGLYLEYLQEYPSQRRNHFIKWFFQFREDHEYLKGVFKTTTDALISQTSLFREYLMIIADVCNLE